MLSEINRKRKHGLLDRSSGSSVDNYGELAPIFRGVVIDLDRVELQVSNTTNDGYPTATKPTSHSIGKCDVVFQMSDSTPSFVQKIIANTAGLMFSDYDSSREMEKHINVVGLSESDLEMSDILHGRQLEHTVYVGGGNHTKNNGNHIIYPGDVLLARIPTYKKGGDLKDIYNSYASMPEEYFPLVITPWRVAHEEMMESMQFSCLDYLNAHTDLVGTPTFNTATLVKSILDDKEDDYNKLNVYQKISIISSILMTHEYSNIPTNLKPDVKNITIPRLNLLLKDLFKNVEKDVSFANLEIGMAFTYAKPGQDVNLILTKHLR